MTSSGVLQALGRFASELSKMTGWRRLCLAFGAGVVASLGLPPLYMVFFLWPAFAVLFWLIDGCGRFRAALVGWFFGFGFSVAGIYWVGSSFLVEAEKFAVLMPFAVAGLAAFMALFTAGVTYLAALSGCIGTQRILIFAAAWLFADWVRSWLFTGFPWNFLGTVWGFSDSMLQLSALGGVWTLTLITVLAAAAPSLLRHAGSKPKATVAIVLVPQVLLLAVWAGGELRLSAAPELGAEVVTGQRFRIVQPAIAQKEKWQQHLRLEHVKTQVNLTLSEGYSEITQVVWAETAVPFLLSDSEELRRSIARVVPPGGYLFTGAPRVEGEGEAREFYNSLHALDRFGEIRATFDKFHLVPFGEYDPLSEFLPLGKLVVSAGNFNRGPGPQHWTLNGLPAASPLICYEVIFPGAVVASDAPRPGWILNVTNDAWFGETSGPHQHFVNARLRAVEEGLPVIRAANTGISAVVDSYGRVVEKLALGERGVVDADLPAALKDITPYARLGNAIVGVLIAGLLLLALLLRLFLNRK